MQYIFLDESGDLGIRGSDYLVISAVLVESPKNLDRIIKNMRRNKFKKELKKANEIKGNKSSDAVIKHMIKKLNDINDTKIYCVVFNKTQNQISWKNKNHLYDYIAGNLAKQINIIDDLEIRIDKSKRKQILRERFDEHFLSNLNEDSKLRKIEIYHSYSHAWSGLQFADIIAWSYFQNFERKNNSYLDLISVNCNLLKL